VSSEAFQEPCDGLLAQGRDWAGRIERDRRLTRSPRVVLRLGPLQCVELAGQKARRHVVVGSSGQPAQQLLGVGVHQHETNRRRDRLSQTIPVRLFQGRAGRDGDFVAGNFGAERAAESIQPRPTIVVGQGDPGPHLLDRFRSMEVVAFEEGAAYCSSERHAQCRLAAAGHAHHDNGQWAYGE
jgi:hypothetical protein